MNTLRQAVQEYLTLRRSLGFKLHDAGKLLLAFVTFMEQHRASYITTTVGARLGAATVDRATGGVGSPTECRAHLRAPSQCDRSTHADSAGGFVAVSPQAGATVPVLGQGDPRPYCARRFRYPPTARELRPWTYHCLFGLLSVTGLRLGEARNLELQDVDLEAAVLTIRGAKFGKSRLIPIHASTRRVLADYLARRHRRWAARAVSSYVFVSNWGNRLDGGEIHRTFYALSRQIGLRGPSDRHGPRLHDLRHRFAAMTLLRWYRSGEDVERQLPFLSAYLGHVHVSDTFWYLSAWPELMREAMSRLERCWEGQS